MAEQLRLPTLRSKLPFSVRYRRVRRATGQYLRVSQDISIRHGFVLRSMLEDEALLVELRCQSRVVCRRTKGRTGAREQIAFAGTLEGRRVHRLMEALSARIAARREALLCG